MVPLVVRPGRVIAVRRTGTTSVRFSLCKPFLCQALSAGFGVYDDGRGNVVVLKLSPVIQARGAPKSRFRLEQVAGRSERVL